MLSCKFVSNPPKAHELSISFQKYSFKLLSKPLQSSVKCLAMRALPATKPSTWRRPYIGVRIVTVSKTENYVNINISKSENSNVFNQLHRSN